MSPEHLALEIPGRAGSGNQSSERHHPKARPLRKAGFIVAGAIVTVVLLAVLIVWCAHRLATDVLPQHPVPPIEVTPIPCHSHNDFWREVPITSALQAGCIGVEADVWPYEGDLFVAHKRDALSPDRTFRRLYTEPLARELELRNAPHSTRPASGAHGIFDADPSQTLVLLVDIKAEPETAWPLLLHALEPLRDRGWLTTTRTGKMATGPVTVVVTGKIPRQLLLHKEDQATPHDIFLDAPLSVLAGSHYHSSNNSYWASDSFTKKIGYVWFGKLRSSQLHRVRQHIRDAHSRGLKARYWGLPTWPPVLRDHVWKTLVQEGVDIINVDNLNGVAEAWEQLRIQ